MDDSGSDADSGPDLGSGPIQVQIPVDNLLKGSSSWLRVVREKHAEAESEVAQ